jgi:type II secretory pathway component PulM
MSQRFDPKFRRFIEYMLGNEEACRVAAELQRQGADLLRVFVELRVYVEGHSVAGERRKRGNEVAKIVNRGVREHGVAPEVGRWLRDRAELAHATNGLSKVHNVDSLLAAHIYLESVADRKVTISEMAHLVDAVRYALGRRPAVSDPDVIRHELARHRKKNARFVKILTHDICSKV